MKRILLKCLTAIFAMTIIGCSPEAALKKEQPIIIAYVGGYNGLE